MCGLPPFSVTHGPTVRPSGAGAGQEGWNNQGMTALPDGFVPGLEGVVAFTTEIAEPDKDGNRDNDFLNKYSAPSIFPCAW